MPKNTEQLARIDKTIGNAIAGLRISSGLTRAKFAEHLDVSGQQLQKTEKGKNRLCASRLYKLAINTNTPLSYFFEDIGIQQNKLQRKHLEVLKIVSKMREKEVLSLLNFLKTSK